jgi:hypothetical protein
MGICGFAVMLANLKRTRATKIWLRFRSKSFSRATSPANEITSTPQKERGVLSEVIV